MEGSEALILGENFKVPPKNSVSKMNNILIHYLLIFVQLCHVLVVHTGSSSWDVESFHCVWAPEIQGPLVVKLRFNCM